MRSRLMEGSLGVRLRLIALGMVMIASASAVALTLAVLRPVPSARADFLCVKPGGGDGCLASIEAALAMAGDGDVIRVAQGTYIENVVISRTVTLQGGWAPDFSQRDLNIFTSTITPADNTNSVVSISGHFGDTSAVVPTLDGFLITGGRAYLASNHGGGVRIIDSDAIVISNTIKNNVAFLLGGGVWVQRGAPVLQGNRIMNNQTLGLGQDAHGGGVQLENTRATLMDNFISRNTITGTLTYGGGLEISGSGNGQVVLLRNQFISNTASTVLNGFGGAIAVINGQARIENSILISNTAVLGGGVFIGGSPASSDLTGQSNLVRANRASQGGGIYNNNQSIALRGSLIISNTATAGGGGLLISAGATISLTNGAIVANLAGADGGAVLNSGIFSFTNATVSGNRAGGMGGGIANFNLGNLSNATIADNTSANGAGIFNGNTINTLNSLIALNQGNNCLGVLTSFGHNLEDSGTCALGQPSDMPNTNASLAVLGDYGGQTQTQALTAGSPAIDAGDNAACAPYDQRGWPRPVDGDGDGQAVCDIGAYEYQAPGPHLYLPVILQY